jgi:DNA-directed RNA polymerase sigma subunit (sigma70/sigma32)
VNLDRRIAEAYEAGGTLASVATALGISPTRVRNALMRMGVPRRRPGPEVGLVNPELEARDKAISEDYVAGATLRQIARARGLSRARILQILQKRGIERRPPKRRNAGGQP